MSNERRKSQIIHRVEVEHYRSLGKVSFELSDLNIFSGLNNSGKSNILRALNLFFNGESRFGEPYSHDLDYSKAYGGHAGNKREIKITVHFHPVGESYLSKPFFITKRFSIDVNNPVPEFHSDDPAIEERLHPVIKKSAADGNVTRQFNTFLSSIRYFYIPAVRDKLFAQRMFGHFEQALAASAQSKIDDSLIAISESLTDISQEVSEDFEKFMGLATQAAVASNLLDILGTISVRVKTPIVLTKHGGEKEDIFVDLFSSGDGVLMSYLPHFLDYLAKKMKRRQVIWGFEEPENSLEYSKIQKLAELFSSEFNKRAQILITTHSPAFINLKDTNKHILFYRVYQDFLSTGKPKKPLSVIKTIEELVRRQATLFDNGKILSEEYEKLTKELFFVEQSSEIEKLVKQIQEGANAHRLAEQEFIDKHRSMRPAKIFVCEDDHVETKKAWGDLLESCGVEGVTVFSSGGATSNQVEGWLKIVRQTDETYDPKIFRVIDGDGLTSTMQAAICGTRANSSQYRYRVFPLNEFENLAVLTDNENFNENFWITNQEVIKNHFDITAEQTCKSWASKFVGDPEKELFVNKSGATMSVVQTMRAEALRAWKVGMPGKEMCKLIPNYKVNQKISSIKNENLPQELRPLIDEVKTFFKNN